MDTQFHSQSKILVVGTSGAGKSTLARHLATRLQLADIELDALFWGPNWQQTPLPVFRDRVTSTMSRCRGWVIHGNYNKISDLTWNNADTVIWLDYSLPVVLWRVIRRSIIRIIMREDLWSGNRESFRKTFLSKDSIILWAFQTYRLRKRQYEDLIRETSGKRLAIYRFRRPSEARNFLRQL